MVKPAIGAEATGLELTSYVAVSMSQSVGESKEFTKSGKLKRVV